jgi:hypothetical protein
MITEEEEEEKRGEEGNKCVTNGCACYKNIKINSLKLYTEFHCN